MGYVYRTTGCITITDGIRYRHLLLKEEMARVKEDMAKMEGSLREDLVKMKIRLIKWFAGTPLALTGVFSGIVFALGNH